MVPHFVVGCWRCKFYPRTRQVKLYEFMFVLKITTKYVLRRVSCVIRPRVISHQRCGSDDTEHMLVVRENYVFVSFG